uniref:Organ specific protein n=1 Tax=Steinernema glaseri TaxID=37863 RepID=A0A1I7XZL8_9BILA
MYRMVTLLALVTSGGFGGNVDPKPSDRHLNGHNVRWFKIQDVADSVASLAPVLAKGGDMATEKPIGSSFKEFPSDEIKKPGNRGIVDFNIDSLDIDDKAGRPDKVATSSEDSFEVKKPKRPTTSVLGQQNPQILNLEAVDKKKDKGQKVPVSVPINSGGYKLSMGAPDQTLESFAPQFVL